MQHVCLGAELTEKKPLHVGILPTCLFADSFAFYSINTNSWVSGRFPPLTIPLDVRLPFSSSPLLAFWYQANVSLSGSEPLALFLHDDILNRLCPLNLILPGSLGCQRIQAFGSSFSTSLIVPNPPLPHPWELCHIPPRSRWDVFWRPTDYAFKIKSCLSIPWTRQPENRENSPFSFSLLQTCLHLFALPL